MNAISEYERRRAPRREAALFVRFSINGGPEHISRTLNFTSKSLAIRSDCTARKGDHVVVSFGSLPSISGEVARTFPEGFAVLLNETSLELMSHTEDKLQSELKEDFSALYAADPVVSPFIRATSTCSARMRIATVENPQNNFKQHYLSVIAAERMLFKNIASIWIKSNETRWTARAITIMRPNDRCYGVIALNDWQLHMAAAYGLTVCIVNKDLEDWSFAIGAAPVANHILTLEPPEMAISA
ncbi:hypothetical protein [Hyphococcus sp.]|uniref:hypothetical protein n=1 Tax=Hyphococcus sp. TaxID=2038636 RepID=UPI003CCBA848